MEEGKTCQAFGHYVANSHLGDSLALSSWIFQSAWRTQVLLICGLWSLLCHRRDTAESELRGPPVGQCRLSTTQGQPSVTLRVTPARSHLRVSLSPAVPRPVWQLWCVGYEIGCKEGHPAIGTLCNALLRLAFQRNRHTSSSEWANTSTWSQQFKKKGQIPCFPTSYRWYSNVNMESWRKMLNF